MSDKYDVKTAKEKVSAANAPTPEAKAAELAKRRTAVNELYEAVRGVLEGKGWKPLAGNTLGFPSVLVVVENARKQQTRIEIMQDNNAALGIWVNARAATPRGFEFTFDAAEDKLIGPKGEDALVAIVEAFEALASRHR